jgi:hypothetical protein
MAAPTSPIDVKLLALRECQVYLLNPLISTGEL